jgi:hypothetical protein
VIGMVHHEKMVSVPSLTYIRKGEFGIRHTISNNERIPHTITLGIIQIFKDPFIY